MHQQPSDNQQSAKRQRPALWQWYKSTTPKVKGGLGCGTLIVILLVSLWASSIFGLFDPLDLQAKKVKHPISYQPVKLDHRKHKTRPIAVPTLTGKRPILRPTLTSTAKPTLKPTLVPTSTTNPQPTVITTAAPVPVTSPGMLPGEQIWKNGVSSYVFGADDTQEFVPDNFETDAAVQKYMHDAGVTLVRSDFDDNASDAANDARMKAIENIGAHGICTLHNIFNVAYDKHVVEFLGNRCLIYEIGNELNMGDDVYSMQGDFRPLSAQEYTNQWNTLVPILRQANPNAKFLGPVTSNDSGDGCHDDGNGGQSCFMQDFLMGTKASGVLPDGISFHYYPCWDDTKATCLPKAASFATVINEVRGWVQSILGKNIPVGITEWESDPSGNQVFDSDASFMQQFNTNALNAMIQAHIDFASRFDIMSYAGYGTFDMFNVDQGNQPKPAFFVLKDMISVYKP